MFIRVPLSIHSHSLVSKLFISVSLSLSFPLPLVIRYVSLSHSKRIHSDVGDDDDGDRVDESLEQRPGKRRAKTDRQPTSP